MAVSKNPEVWISKCIGQQLRSRTTSRHAQDGANSLGLIVHNSPFQPSFLFLTWAQKQRNCQMPRAESDGKENPMDATLKKDAMVGNWEKLKTRVKLRWGRLTDDQLDRISGHYDELTYLVRERYGYTKEKARQEVDEFIQRLSILELQP
jgi:uncharacterized protein YjbJ (UPF0337 family)